MRASIPSCSIRPPSRKPNRACPAHSPATRRSISAPCVYSPPGECFSPAPARTTSTVRCLRRCSPPPPGTQDGGSSCSRSRAPGGTTPSSSTSRRPGISRECCSGPLTKTAPLTSLHPNPLARHGGEVRPETALVRRVFLGLLVANLIVVGAKSFVGLKSGSLAILGSALDSSVDALNNVLALIVVRVAAKEPDEDHPYGHGKFETLGALGIVGFLSITCFELIRGAVNELLQGPHPVGVTDFQLVVLVLTLGVNVVIAWYENRRGVDREADVAAAHAIADQVEERLKRDLQLHEVTVHVEPC